MPDLEEEYLDVFQNFESAVAGVYREHPELTDYDVDKAYTALIQDLRREADGKPGVPPKGELAVRVWEQLTLMSDWRLGRWTLTEDDGKEIPKPEPVSVEVILLCLKRLRKSLDTWTKQGGRQGYLEYISKFV